MIISNRCIQLFFQFAFLAGVALSAASAETPNETLRSDTAPNWVVQTVDGARLSLDEQTQGDNKVVMVFWATWCRYCQQLMPQLNAMKGELQSDGNTGGVSFATFNIWEDGDPILYMEQQQLRLPLALRAENIAKKYQVRGTPAVFVIGNKRKILYRRQPGHSIARTVAEIDKIVRPGQGQ